MNNKDSRIILENQENDFFYKKNNSKLNISFNRVSFIFFVFFIIFIIYSIHLIHLGSRKAKTDNIQNSSNKLYRADIVDINEKYLVKTINSIDIGISPSKIIDEKKIIIKFEIYFS